MSKYIVICVIEREISKVGVADTLSEAIEIMENDFMKNYLDSGRSEDDLYCEVGKGDGWNLSETEAWFNKGNNNYDWRILEVE